MWLKPLIGERTLSLTHPPATRILVESEFSCNTSSKSLKIFSSSVVNVMLMPSVPRGIILGDTLLGVAFVREPPSRSCFV